MTESHTARDGAAAYLADVELDPERVRERLDAAERDDFGDEWMRGHKGGLRKIVGHVWGCGDDYCDCTQAQVTAYFHNSQVSNAQVPVGLWEGEFHTDGESGAREELVALRAELTARDVDLAARIEWLDA